MVVVVVVVFVATKWLSQVILVGIEEKKGGRGGGRDGRRESW